MWGPQFHTPTAHWLDFTPTCLPCLNFPHLSHDVYCFSIPSNSVSLSLVYVWNFPPPLQNSSIFSHLVGISRLQHLSKLQLLNRLAEKGLHTFSFSLCLYAAFYVWGAWHTCYSQQIRCCIKPEMVRGKIFFSLTNINTYVEIELYSWWKNRHRWQDEQCSDAQTCNYSLFKVCWKMWVYGIKSSLYINKFKQARRFRRCSLTIWFL